MTDERSIDARLAALQARRAPESAFAPPSGEAVELPAPPADPVIIARTGPRRSLPARRTRIGVTIAAAAGFVALVPVMGPLTAAPADDDIEPADPTGTTKNSTTSTDSVPEGGVDTTIDLTSTTDVPVDSLVTETTTESTLAVDETAVAPVDPSGPAPAAPAPVAPAPAPPPAAPAAPAPAPAPAPPATTPPPAPVAPAPTTAPPPPVTTAPPTTPPPTTAPPPVTTTPPPPPTTAPPPPPTTSPS